MGGAFIRIQFNSFDKRRCGTVTWMRYTNSKRTTYKSKLDKTYSCHQKHQSPKFNHELAFHEI